MLDENPSQSTPNNVTSSVPAPSQNAGTKHITSDMVSVIANAGSFDAPSSFDDGYDSSNTSPRSPGKVKQYLSFISLWKAFMSVGYV